MRYNENREIRGGMILHRLKRQTAKIKIDLCINVLCKKLTENNFQRSQAESDADRLIVHTINFRSFLSSCSCCTRGYVLKC
jgi:hypothetical protein